jgi:phage FluMu protein gp41
MELRSARPLEELSLDELEALWQAAKQELAARTADQVASEPRRNEEKNGKEPRR